MTARLPPLLDEAADGLDLRAHRAAGEVALGGVRRAAASTVTGPSGSASGVPKRSTAFGTSVAMTSTSASTVRASRAAPRSLSMTASTPAQRAVVVADDGDPAAAVGDHDEAGVDQRVHGAGVEDLERLGRGDDAAPALLAAVLPGLAVLDEQRGLVGGQEAADRLGRAW